MNKIKGKDLIAYIKGNNLEEADVEVSGIIQTDGDHENLKTDQIDLQTWDNKFTIYIGDTLE